MYLQPWYFSAGVPEKLGGAICMHYDEDHGRGNFLWTHTTASMGIGFQSTGEEEATVKMSRLPVTTKRGTTILVGAVSFNSQWTFFLNVILYKTEQKLVWVAASGRFCPVTLTLSDSAFIFHRTWKIPHSDTFLLRLSLWCRNPELSWGLLLFWVARATLEKIGPNWVSESVVSCIFQYYPCREM